MKIKYNHLTLGERALIQTQLQQGFKPSVIAASLGRHRSSIIRELRRNGWKSASDVRSVGRPPIAGGYSCNQANGRAKKLAAIPRIQRKLKEGSPLWAHV